MLREASTALSENNNEVAEAWFLGWDQGKRDQRVGCDICPLRSIVDGLSVLIPGEDYLRRPGVLN
jgi:hypothetical protein